MPREPAWPPEAHATSRGASLVVHWPAMPAKNPRVNVVLERPMYDALGRLARRVAARPEVETTLSAVHPPISPEGGRSRPQANSRRVTQTDREIDRCPTGDGTGALRRSAHRFSAGILEAAGR